MHNLKKSISLLSVLHTKESRRISCIILNTIQELAEITLRVQTKFPDAGTYCVQISKLIDELGSVVKQLLGLKVSSGKGIFDETIVELK